MKHMHDHPVTKDFLALTKFTCPHGWENDLYDDLMVGTYGASKDVMGNYFITIPGSNVLFTCHMDTAGGGKAGPQRVRRVWKPGGILATDGTTLLGADDKAGMAVLLHMVRAEVPGIYAFYVGEERGCVGSNHHAVHYDTYLPHLGIEKIDQVVSFDRYGYESVITHQLGMCASDKYAWAVSEQYARHGITTLAPDPHGLFTDSAQFTELVAECTNISVGYDGHHGVTERQDVEFLIQVAEASALVQWNDLPIVRQPSEDDYSGYDGTYFEWREGADGVWRRNVKSYRRSRAYREAEDDDIEELRRQAVHYPTMQDILDPETYWRDEELIEFAERNPTEAGMVIATLLDERFDLLADLDQHYPPYGKGGGNDGEDDDLYALA